MTNDGQFSVGARHSIAVVRDADERHAAAFDIDTNASCVGIERIFDQLFDHARRAFDDFTRGNLIG